jgi:hypothetical protein
MVVVSCLLCFVLRLQDLSLVVSSLSQRFILRLFPQGERTGMLPIPTYASATPSYIPSLVHVKHAKVEMALVRFSRCHFFQSLGSHI